MLDKEMKGVSAQYVPKDVLTQAVNLLPAPVVESFALPGWCVNTGQSGKYERD